MPFCSFHWSSLIFIISAAEHTLSTTDQTCTWLWSSRTVKQNWWWRWTRCYIKIFQIQFCCFVFNSFVIDYQMISNSQLIMRITTKQCTVYFFFSYSKFLYKKIRCSKWKLLINFISITSQTSCMASISMIEESASVGNGNKYAGRSFLNHSWFLSKISIWILFGKSLFQFT